MHLLFSRTIFVFFSKSWKFECIATSVSKSEVVLHSNASKHRNPGEYDKECSKKRLLNIDSEHI